MLKLAVDDVQVGSANRASLDSHQQLARPWLGVQELGFAKRFSGRMQNLCAHGS